MEKDKKEQKIRKKIRLGITLGEVGGIGPEIVINSFQEPSLRELFTPIIYGSAKALNFYRKILSVEKFSYTPILRPSEAQPKRVHVIDPGTRIDNIEVGQATVTGGQAALESLNLAIQHLKANELDALVTMPIDKNSVAKLLPEFTGHTEYIAKELGVKDQLMFLISEELKVGTVTGHVPLKNVSGAITQDKILSKIRIMNLSLKMDFSLQKPRIAVLGLNPHSGDTGLLGREEVEIIAPAVKAAEAEGIFVMGPFSPDGFFATHQYSRFDGILAMYHDQGLIPFKLLAGYSGVNFTAGLPIVRTSPDHGVAYDLAGKNLASLESFMNALYASEDIFRNRTDNEALQKGSLKNKGIRIEVGEEEGEVALEE